MNTILQFVVLLSAVLPAILALSENFTHNLWISFTKEHGKQFFSTEHESYRYEIFKKNLALIERHNANYALGLHHYTMALNVFGDWTPEEFKATMLGTRLNMTRNKNASIATFMRMPSNVRLPTSSDWREQGAVTPVKNQGQCGSCWAFSTTGSLEAAHFRQKGKLVSLSEQQLVDCSATYQNAGCNGGLMDNAFEYIKENHGIDTEDSYPYHARVEKCHFKKKNVGATCTGFVDIPSGDENAMMEAVATVGPVSVAIDATQEKFMFYKEGIFVDDTCTNGPDSLDHGVLVVGYGTNTTNTGENMDFWIVKNSWGPEWGEQGYIRMARNLNNMCGIATSASYPLVK